MVRRRFARPVARVGPAPDSRHRCRIGLSSETDSLNSWPRLYRSGDLLVMGSLTGAVGLFSMSGNEFDKPAALATPGYKSNPNWAEGFIEPGVTARYSLGSGASLYGGYAWMGTATRHRQRRHRQHLARRQRAALRRAQVARCRDGSVAEYLLRPTGLPGRRGNAALEGGEQRAATPAPIRSADVPRGDAALVTAGYGDFKLQGFWLKPNEATSAATGRGSRAPTSNGCPPDRSASARCGSTCPIPRSSPAMVLTSTTFGRVHPIAVAPNFWLEADYAWERTTSLPAAGFFRPTTTRRMCRGSRCSICATPRCRATTPGRRRGRVSTRSTSAAAIPTGIKARSARRFSGTRTSMSRAGVTLDTRRKEHLHPALPLFQRCGDQFAAVDSRAGPAAAERWRRSGQAARERARLLVDLRDRQAAQCEWLRRLCRARLGLQEPVRGEWRQRERLVVLRRAIQLQLLTRPQAARRS